MIVVCGEALIDLVPINGADAYAARPGGSPANVAVALGRLGVEVSLLARMSEDHFGRLLHAHLTRSHVELSVAPVVPAHTTLAVVSLAAGGDAVYSFYVEGCTDGTWRVEDLPAQLPAGAALHVSGSLALAVPSMGETIGTLLRREHGRRLITFDPNPRPSLVDDREAAFARLDEWLGLADIVKVSAEDLGWLAPGVGYEEVAKRWQDQGCALVVVTRGGDGVYALGAGGPVWLPAQPVRLVDTVGAGDSFMAGLLTALSAADRLSRDGLASVDLPSVLGFAQRVAAVTCGRQGADPPWRHEL